MMIIGYIASVYVIIGTVIWIICLIEEAKISKILTPSMLIGSLIILALWPLLLISKIQERWDAVTRKRWWNTPIWKSKDYRE